MQLRKLLIADCSEAFLLAMQEALEGHYRITACRSGRKALEFLRAEHCDILLLDLMLPEMDGITLLEEAAAEGIRPIIIAATALINDYVIESAQRLGFGYLVRKPCDVHAVAARIQDLCRTQPASSKKADARGFVSSLLLALGLKPKHNGFNYLLEAVISIEQNPDQSFTKELYPAIGKHFGRNGKLVERSMRSALDTAWECREEAVWLQYFPAGDKRPTSAAFICRLSEELRRWKSE